MMPASASRRRGAHRTRSSPLHSLGPVRKGSGAESPATVADRRIGHAGQRAPGLAPSAVPASWKLDSRARAGSPARGRAGRTVARRASASCRGASRYSAITSTTSAARNGSRADRAPIRDVARTGCPRLVAQNAEAAFGQRVCRSAVGDGRCTPRPRCKARGARSPDGTSDGPSGRRALPVGMVRRRGTARPGPRRHRPSRLPRYGRAATRTGGRISACARRGRACPPAPGSARRTPPRRRCRWWRP